MNTEDMTTITITTETGSDLMVTHLYKDMVDAWLENPTDPTNIANLGFQIVEAYESWNLMSGLGKHAPVPFSWRYTTDENWL